MKEFNKKNLKDFTKSKEFKDSFKEKVIKNKKEITIKNKEADLKGH